MGGGVQGGLVLIFFWFGWFFWGEGFGREGLLWDMIDWDFGSLFLF